MKKTFILVLSFILVSCGGDNSVNSDLEISSGAKTSSSSVGVSSGSVSSSSFVAPGSSSGTTTSSSSVGVSCSSVISSSSAQSLYDPETHTLTDLRDGRTYKTVEIGNQVWMAENLRYIDSVATENLKGGAQYITPTSLTINPQSYCEEKVPCETFGIFYKWTSALNIPMKYNKTAYTSITLPWQGICPDSWHLPSKEEFDTLVLNTEGHLREWIEGDDIYGFTGLPGQYIGEDGVVLYGGYVSDSRLYLWTASQYAPVAGVPDPLLGTVFLIRGSNNPQTSDFVKERYVPVRCIKD